MQDKEVRELKTILKNNGKDTPFENRLLRKVIKYKTELIQSQQDLKVAVEALESIAYRDITIKSNFYSSTVANEALAKLRKGE